MLYRTFFGTAAYTTEVTMDPVAKGTRIEINLGCVEVIARVYVKGTLVRTMWAPPFKTNITQPSSRESTSLRWRSPIPGTTAWPTMPHVPNPQRKTWTASAPGAVPLIPAGLPGPVTLRAGEILAAPESP